MIFNQQSFACGGKSYFLSLVCVCWCEIKIKVVFLAFFSDTVNATHVARLVVFIKDNFITNIIIICNIHRYLWTGPYMVPLIAPPPLFFNIAFFSCTQHFATFYVSLYDIYTIKTITQQFLSIPGFCILYMSEIRYGQKLRAGK